MLTFSRYAHLRYVLLINIVAALVPAMDVKGRDNDPLLHASWWKLDQHSAVLVVAIAAVFGALLIFAAARKDFRRWWFFVGCGIFVGIFPATFYLAVAPHGAYLPLADMYVSGTFCGTIAGVLLNQMLGKPKKNAAA